MKTKSDTASESNLKNQKNKKCEKTKSDAAGESNFEKCPGTAKHYTTDITRLKKKMKDLEDESHQVVSTIYISGTPGSGKSQLARQLGQEFFCTRSRDADDL